MLLGCTLLKSNTGNSMKLLASMLVLSAIVAVAQDRSADPGGWTKAKWGMLGPQIKEVFPEAKDIPGLQHYQIGPIKYRITFDFDKKAGGLIGVSLMAEEAADTTLGVYASAAKDALLGALRDKYGEPTSTQDTPDSLGVTHDWKWLLPQTALDLTYVEARERKYRFTILQYSKREKSDQL